jgi:hypothetical protein
MYAPLRGARASKALETSGPPFGRPGGRPVIKDDEKASPVRRAALR